MGIRDALDAHPQATKAVLSLVVLVAVGVAAKELMGENRRVMTKLPDVFFTDDDGKTFFKASSDNVPPWDHNGKTAVAAYVYRCDGKNFVGFMARFTPETQKKVIAAGRVSAGDETAGRELKTPGNTAWVRASDMKRASPIVNVKGPNGQENIEPIEPE